MVSEMVEIESRCRRGHPAFELEEVLDVLRESGRHLHWSIEKLYAVGRPALLGRTMWQIGDEITRTPGGFRLSWDELEVFAASCFQVVDARLVGRHDTAGGGDLVVEVEAGRRWRITAGDQAILERCRSLEAVAPAPSMYGIDEPLLVVEEDQTSDLPC